VKISARSGGKHLPRKCRSSAGPAKGSDEVFSY